MILGTNGAIRVEDKIQPTLSTMSAGGGASGSIFEIAQKEGRKYVEGVAEPKEVVEAIRSFPNVAAVSEVVHGAVLIRTALRSDSVRVYGVNLEDHLHSTDLIDCSGRISHRLTVLVDGRVRVRSGEVEAIVDPATGDVSPPWCRLVSSTPAPASAVVTVTPMSN